MPRMPFSLTLDPTILREGERHTLSVILMDRSRSMGAFGSAPLHAMNSHLAQLQDEDAAANASAVIVSFADTAQIETPHASLREIQPLEGFKPDGCTRLHATIADTLRSLIATVQRPEWRGRVDVVLAVFTDGEDNPGDHREPRTPATEVSGLAAEAQMLGFKLILVGIGLDAKKKAAEIGFPLDQALKVAANPEGISRSMARVTHITSLTMSGIFSGRDSTPPN